MKTKKEMVVSVYKDDSLYAVCVFDEKKRESIFYAVDKLAFSDIETLFHESTKDKGGDREVQSA